MTRIGVSEFGTTASGQTVRRITIGAGDLTASILTWGAVLQSVRLAGVDHDLTLGSDHMADYQGAMRHHGALVAPVVNRLSGGKAVIAGKAVQFETNQDGRHTLHSGAAGTHLKLWEIAEHTTSSVTLRLTMPDGEGGFPGTRPIAATFTVEAPATLRLSVTATTDKPTLMNAANHSYWTMDGAQTWAGHRLRIAADAYLPTTDTFTPTGAITPTADTACDFATARAISPGAPPLDNNFCLAANRRALTEVLWLTGRSGLSMTIATTEPGIQIYDGRRAIRPGHAPYEGLAIEAQFWPDAPNHAGFPSIELAPDQTCEQITEWRFAKT